MGKDPEEGQCVELTCEDRKELFACMNNDPTLWRAEAWAAYAQVSDELQRARAQVRCDRRARWPPAAKAAHRCKIEIAEREVEVAQNDLDAALRAMALRKHHDDYRPTNASATTRARLARLLCAIPRYFYATLRRFCTALKMYYTGARIERTWSAIHRASATLYMLYDESELPAQARRLHALVVALPDLNSHLTSLTEILPELKAKAGSARQKVPTTVRPMLRELYREAMDVTESLQTEARGLRNSLLAASGALLVILLSVGLWHVLNDRVVSLCVESKRAMSEVCPAGEIPHPFDVFAIELAGMLGGVLSAVIPIATGERIKTPYRVFNHQLALKILAGGAAGLAGVMLVEGRFVSTLTVTSKATIFGYAIFFGFAQQALTGLIDRRASSLAKETPITKSV